MANDYSRKPFCLEFGKSTASCIGRCSSPHLGPEHTVNMVCEIFKLEVKSKVKVIKLSGTILPLVVMEPNGQTFNVIRTKVPKWSFCALLKEDTD